MNKNPKYTHLALHRFKPGQSGNPAGRPKSYVTVLKELGYTKPVIATMVAEIAFMNYPDVLAILRSDTEPIIRQVIARAFVRGVGKGEYKYVAGFLELLFGRSVPYLPTEQEQGKLPDN